MSLFDRWRVANRWDPNILLDFLESVPAPWIQRIEVIGVDHHQEEAVYKLDLRNVAGYEHGVDHKVEMEETIRMVYPEAMITFRTVDRIDQS